MPNAFQRQNEVLESERLSRRNVESAAWSRLSLPRALALAVAVAVAFTLAFGLASDFNFTLIVALALALALAFTFTFALAVSLYPFALHLTSGLGFLYPPR